MSKTYIGMDNGISGTLAILGNNKSSFVKIPTFIQQSYTKTKQNITRVDCKKLIPLLPITSKVFCLIERPMVNPTRWKASLSAIRCLEATLIILETLNIPYQYCDSKEWQKELLPKGLKKEDLKKGSLDIGLRLFPEHREMIEKHKDADGLLIAEYARRHNF